MVLVLGSAVVKEDSFVEALTLSLEHCRRSRSEAGCIDHAVHQDIDNRRRLVFVEKWADRESLKAHFRLPESRAFASRIGAIAQETPQISVYDARESTSVPESLPLMPEKLPGPERWL